MTYSFASYGGGTNSTAMLIEMALRGMDPPNAILFADTGGERPDTYEYVDLFSDWLVKQGYPAIITVRQDVTLEEDCLRRNALPAVAYGWKTCSERWKIRPQRRWLKEQPEVQAVWAAGERVICYIGIDYDEVHRAHFQGDDKYDNQYPLIDWKMGREACVETIRGCQLPLPGKSACFFCPNSKTADVRRLQQQHPDLLQRALDMEANADLTKVPGLGRQWSWAGLVAQGTMFPEMYQDDDKEMACGCYDGEAA